MALIDFFARPLQFCLFLSQKRGHSCCNCLGKKQLIRAANLTFTPLSFILTPCESSGVFIFFAPLFSEPVFNTSAQAGACFYIRFTYFSYKGIASIYAFWKYKSSAFLINLLELFWANPFIEIKTIKIKNLIYLIKFI